MRSLKPLSLVAVGGMAALALLPPIANAGASQPASTVEASKKKPKRGMLKRGYRGETSQGEPIAFQTFSYTRGVGGRCAPRCRDWVRELDFNSKHVCKNAFGATYTKPVEFAGQTPLRGTAFATELREGGFGVSGAVDPSTHVATVTGKAGATTASGRASVTGTSEESGASCAEAQFAFDIPKVSERWYPSRRPLRRRRRAP